MSRSAPRHEGAKAHVWSSTKRGGRGKKKSNNSWYAVVRGHVPGVYANWDDAKAQTNRFTESRPYKARSRGEAIEIFMRWSGGAQLHPASSTMASRGESLDEYAGAFLGLEGAKVIRARAVEKHARERQRKFEETGDPIWDTGARASRNVRSVEVARNATTPAAPSVHAGMDTPASAGVPTTKPPSSVGAHKGSTHQRDAPDSPAPLHSPIGTGVQDKDAFAPHASLVTGDAHEVHSPVERWEVEASPMSLNSGAVEGVEVQYAGKGNSSLGDEPQLQNTTAASETRGPLMGEPQHPDATRSRDEHTSEGGSGEHEASTHDSIYGEGATGRRHQHTRTPAHAHASNGGSDTATGASTQSDRARARALFRSSDSTQSATSPEEIKSAEAAIRTLEAWGFSAIGKSEAERQKQRDLRELNRDLAAAGVITPAGQKATNNQKPGLIPKKQKQWGSTSGKTGAIPVPVPTGGAPTHSMSAKQEPGKREVDHGDKHDHSRRPPKEKHNKEMSKQQLQKIIRQRERRLAEAVLTARRNEAEEEAMMRRIIGHQQQPEQTYWRRLRRATYFEDSSDSELRHTRAAHVTEDADNDSPNRAAWTGEPKQKGAQAVIQQLHARIQNHERENSELKQQLSNVMTMLVEMRKDMKAARLKRGATSSDRKEGPGANNDHVKGGPSPKPAHLDSEQPVATTAGSDGHSTSGHTTADSQYMRPNSKTEGDKEDNAGQADDTGKSTSTDDSSPLDHTRNSKHKRPTLPSDSSSVSEVPIPSVGPRIPTPSVSGSSVSSLLSARHEERAAASAKAGRNDPARKQTEPSKEQEETKREDKQTVIDLTGAEPSATPPTLPDGTLGLQQLLIGSKTLKFISMDKLYSANPDTIVAWRIKRKRYLKQVAEHNAGHAIKLTPQPVKDFVDEVIWNAVSKKKLLKEHRTKKGEPANHVQCAAYFTGTGEYKGHVVTVSTDAMQTLKSVKYQRGRQGATHEDRWFSFTSRRDKALEKIPAAQRDNIRFKEAHARYLRSALRPKSLREHVASAYSSGIHPGTKIFTPWWMLETKKNVDKTEEMIEDIIEYMDARQREGLGDHAWDEPATGATTSQKTTEVCNNWRMGKCTKGENCPRKHVGASGAGTTPPKRTGKRTGTAGNERPIGPENMRCEKDKLGQKCTYGEKCFFAHRHGINPRKDAVPRTPPKDHSDKTCNACGEKGNIMWKCEKLKAHEAEIKAAIGYTGDPKWLMDKENSRKCIALFRQKQWFAVSVHNPDIKPARPEAIAGGAADKYKLPYKIERNLIDAGWCWIGWGTNKVQLRLYVDLGATCSFSSEAVYKEIVPKAANGSLGCARIAPEIKNITSDSWDGKKKNMKNWMQLTITADNVQGVQTICVGQYVSFDRKGDDRVLTAGKDLAKDLGFVHPTKQIEAARVQGVSPESLLGDDVPKRTYVLSAEEKTKREDNRMMATKCATVHADGLAYVGDVAFNHVRPMEWTHEPLLQHSYMTTAALHQAGTSARQLPHEGVINELAVNDFLSLQDWIVGHTQEEGLSIGGLVEVDILRVTSETKRLTRVLNTKLRVIQSTARRVVIGNDI